MNVAFWSSPLTAFMLVGLAPEQMLDDLAAELSKPARQANSRTGGQPSRLPWNGSNQD